MIVGGGNDVVAQVKGNQPTLLGAVVAAVDVRQRWHAESNERSRGRQERRTLTLWRDEKLMATIAEMGWTGVRSVYCIEQSGIRNGQPCNYARWYISSATLTAEEFLAVSRLHWQVENNCHRVKDVALNEDATATSHHNANRALALLRNFTVNIYRMNGCKSIKYAIENFTNYVNVLYQFITRT